MFKKIKVIFDLRFVLNCIIYSLLGVYYIYFMGLCILIVQACTGTFLTSQSVSLLNACKLLFVVLGAIPACILINKFKNWLFSLPFQYVLYFIVLVIADILGINEVWRADGLAFSQWWGIHLQIPLGLLILQIPGVVVGCSIRAVIDYFIRKVTAKRQRTI